jgi:hypothetical protein
MTRHAIGWGATAVLAVCVITPGLARPPYLQAFKTHYKTAQGKPTLNAANCALCHVGMPAQAMFNTWGTAVRAELKGAKMVAPAAITAAFTAAESKTNPGTRQTFLAMINGDRMPGGNMRAGGGGGGGGMGGGGGAVGAAGPWEPVFNNVNMDGLTKLNQGNWAVQDGVLKYTGGGNGWMRGNKQFTNYSMVVVWRYTEPGTGQNNDAGVFLKAKAGDNGNPWPGSPQLNMGPQQNFGSVGGTQGGRPRFDLIKANDWNTYQITVQGNTVTLAINGQVAWDQAVGQGLTGPGYIGFQCENRPFEIAQWWIRPLQ